MAFYGSADILATCLMNFFYLLSGFVMTLGYGERSRLHGGSSM